MLPITPTIAAQSTNIRLPLGDPADRLISATALVHQAPLVTIDRKLRDSAALKTIW